MSSGEACYRRFLNGDRDAFSEVVDIYRAPLIFFINRYFCSLSLSEELAEDCFVELIVNPRRYNFKSSLKTYLFTIARNKSVDFIRKNKHLVSSSEDVLSLSSEESLEFEQDILKDEAKKSLHKALGRLIFDYRTVLHLLYFENMSYEQAGSVMKKTKKQIENLAYRAKIALRNTLEKEGFRYEE